MKEFYTIDIAGIKRDLPLCPINDELYIGAFIMFGDVEITRHSAEKLLEIAPEHDIMITAECKGIPLLYEMSRKSGNNDYIVARKGPKLYMKNVMTVEVDSITTDHRQILCIGDKEQKLLNGKRVLIVDDVISTGESLHALEELVKKAGGIIVGKMAVLAEGDATKRDDIKFLARLPLFDKNGDVIDE